MASLIEILLDIIYQWNWCRLMFIFYIVVIVLGGTLVNYLTSVVPLPDSFLQAFKYGKMAHKKANAFITFFEMPKRWFCHFYALGSIMTTAALLQMWLLYVGGSTLPAWEKMFFDIFASPMRKQTVTVTAAVIGTVLLTLQIFRRLYECLFVSTFSSARMNILHYTVGHTHYFGSLVLLLSHAPGFDGQEFDNTFSKIETCHIVGTVICLFAYMVQFSSLSILANLRKNSGKNSKERHILPRGGMFEFLSCPHMLAESLVYVGIAVVLWNHIEWLIVTLWVISNQIQVAVMNHRWYRGNFKDYPRKRRAIIPFLL